MADTPKSIDVSLDAEMTRAMLNSGALGMIRSLRLTLQELPSEYRTFHSALAIIANVEALLEKEMR